MKLQVQQKSIRLSRTIQPFPLQGVLAPNLCLLALVHSFPSDSPVSQIPLAAALPLRDYWEGEEVSCKAAIQHERSCLGVVGAGRR